LVELLEGHNARIIDENVDTTERFQSMIDDDPCIVIRSDVARRG
jgi:hypothetical protein